MTPSSTSERRPPTAAATTGVPHAAASSATRPNDSAAARHQAHVGGAVVARPARRGAGAGRSAPVARRRARRPARAAGRSSASPSGPLGPPTTSSIARRVVELGQARATARSTPLSGWMRPTNSSTGPSQAELGPLASPRSVARHRTEDRVVDAGRDDLDAVGVGAVERRELVALGLGRREHQVGAGDDLRLDARPQRGVVVDRRRRPSPGRACGTSRRAAGRARASAGGRPRPRASSSRGSSVVGAVAARRAGWWPRRIGSTRSIRSCLDTGAAGPASRCTTRKPGSTSTTSGASAPLAPDEHVALDAGPGERATRARARRRSCRRRRRSRLRERRCVHAEDGETATRHGAGDPNRQGLRGIPAQESASRPVDGPSAGWVCLGRRCWNDR